MRQPKYDCVATLQTLGITYNDAEALRRVSMTLHRWHELECGDGNGYVGRDETTGKPFWQNLNGTILKFTIPDRERGALNRLRSIMLRYPTLSYYVQTDPRGAALYILRPGDVPEGSKPDECYSRGIVVCK